MGTKPVILVVEDNTIAREGLALVLRLDRYHVDTADNGQSALDYLGTHPPPAMILLDMMMPVLDGWHFLKQLTKYPPSPKPAILITTANLTIGLEWAKAHGCDGILRKPLEAE